MNTFSDNGRKPSFSDILWPIEGPNLANMAKKAINSEHSPNKCKHEVWIGLREYFSDNGRNPLKVIFWSLDGRNWVNIAQHRSISEN